MKQQPPINWDELKYKHFEDQLFTVYPWMFEGALCMVHSWRGVGKTFFSLGLAQAVASGSPFLKWATNPGGVFYFDCEMGESAIYQRYLLMDRAAKRKTLPRHFNLFSFEHMGGYTWNLTDPKNQEALDNLIGDSKLLILDNLSAAIKPVGREDFKTAYGRARDWLLSLKNRKIGVLIVHHSGKEGKQRGISDIEDPLDIVINLRRPEDWMLTDGSVFEFHFEKTRALNPSDPTVLQPITIKLESTGDHDVKWHWEPLEQARKQKAEEVKKEYKRKREDKINDFPF